VPVAVRKKLRDLVAGTDALATRVAHGAFTLIFWPVAYAVALGSGAYVLGHRGSLAVVYTNKVPTAETFRMGFWTLGAYLATILLYAAIMLGRRLRRGDSGGFGTIAEINRRLRPILALPVLPILSTANIERDSPKETFFLVLLVAVAVGAGAYAWVRPAPLDTGDPVAMGPPALIDAPPPRRPIRAALSRLAAGLSIAGLFAGYGGFFSWLAITNHRALNTRTTDLGYYDNIFYNSAHGRPLGCSFIKAGYHGSAHFDPLLVALSPLYYLYPRAEMLLVLQSVWLAAGVVPLYLLAERKLGRRLPAVAIAAMYAVYPALHGANMYEFHSLTLLSPIALALLYFLEIEAYRRYFVTLAIALLCREDVALLMCFVGAYAVYTRRPRMARAGWITISASVVYFAVVKRFFMTSADIFMSGKNSYSFAYYYDDLIPNHNGIGGMLLSLVTNPVFVVKTVMAEAKLVYVVTLFLPLLFLPFVAKPGRVMLVYGLFFCMLATRGAVFSPHFQYSSVIIPAAFALTPEALRQIEDGRLARAIGLDGHRLSRALVPAAFAASLLVSWKFGGVLENQAFKGGFVRVARSLSDKDRETYAWVRENAAKIPEQARVGVTNRVGAQVSNRKIAYFYPEHQDVDWLFLDEAEIKGAELDKHHKAVQAGTWIVVARRDRLAFYKRGNKPGAHAAAPSPLPALLPALHPKAPLAPPPPAVPAPQPAPKR